ncbi:hypothetical protein [Nonomuraea gerenzanensis]|uniref:Phage protein n=1 Tax=Nonomuraea gerenzanensis TaxID=93944 RepID=A0A1M4EMN1_9ACTN|nr:hypothetical protein [Nonomuraea gerenzanensis]UBU11606.1 hypothetical protein LCN96_46090 [Nonomuraea gerenzanensis]SBP00101.1 hypothetical protein BN4615_P9617 [Nonomuraea gerenzanensis]
MASLAQLREGLAVRLRTIPVLTVHPQVPESITPPVAVITPGFEGEPCIRFDSTMARGADDFLFTVTLLVSMADDRSGQEELDAYLDGTGDRSIKAVIEADPSLGDLVHFAHVREARNYGPQTWGRDEARYVGVDFAVEITA